MEIMGFKPEAMERAAAAKATYTAAIKDWAINGKESPYAFDPDTARVHVEPMTNDMAMAHTKFQLGQYLLKNERGNEANGMFAECRDLHPYSWNIFRQTTEKTDTGIAAGEDFWGKVTSLGDKEYYKTVDMAGMS
jgi:hypothetical protein